MRQITFEAGDAEISVLIKIIKSMISPSIFITQRWETPCLNRLMSTISGSQRANAQRPDVSLHLRSDADVRLWLLWPLLPRKHSAAIGCAKNTSQ